MQGSDKRIAYVEKCELQKIAVMGIKSPYAMLAQDDGEVCVRNKVAAGRDP
jgi:hypothetical protein